MHARLCLATTVVAVTLTGASLAAHHSFAAEFDANKPITLVGAITKIEWVNPHAWIWIDVKARDGKLTNWAVELAPPNALLKRGWRRDVMRIGTVIKIGGYAAKSGREVANGIEITLPDGSRVLVESSGTGAPRR